MDVHHLVDMANQIGSFYAAEPDQQQARLDTATHLRRFWDPRMREALLTHLDKEGGKGLEPFLLETVREHRALLMPKAAPTRPAAKG
jgi:formate dehydrogenase subunit delta